MSSSVVTSSPGGDAPVASRISRQELHVVSARKNVNTRVREIWQYRELLLSLVRKELKVKYKDSVLGFAWSMLNPAFTLSIYYVVFQIILGNGIPMFAIFLLSGLLVWNFFSNALAGATGSVTGNGGLVKKVSFPREVLPLASVGAALFNFMLQTIVMVLALAVFVHAPSPEYLLLAVVALAILTLFASALSIFLSAVNVKFRDTQHLLELVLMLWFWGTPIVYQYAGRVHDGVASHGLRVLYFANPITPIVLTFQRAFYNMLDPKATKGGGFVKVLRHDPITWYAWHLGIVFVVACIFLYGALAIFGRLEGNFAEEL
jgi:ABC-2 type transport system permease protein